MQHAIHFSLMTVFFIVLNSIDYINPLIRRDDLSDHKIFFYLQHAHPDAHLSAVTNDDKLNSVFSDNLSFKFIFMANV